jgi:signal transduction histidine kinase
MTGVASKPAEADGNDATAASGFQADRIAGSGAPPGLGLGARDEAGLLRRQESLLIVLNLGVLGGLIGIHLAFAPLITAPVLRAVALFAARALMQALELAWVRGCWGIPAATVLRRYAAAAVWINVAFAGLVSLASGVPHSHYIVLMVLPTIAAAFRSGWRGLAAVIGVTVAFTLLYVGAVQSPGSHEARIEECFEAATDTLAYVAVALVVHLLALELQGQQRHLRQSLAELERTRDRLIAEEKLAAVGRLSAAIAHEIRNPVGMIASAVATAQHAGYAPSAREEMYAIVAQESGRLERLTDDFLSFARQAELQLQSTSPGTLLDYLAALTRPRASAKQVQVAVECAVEQQVCVDATLVQQALLNLALNAVEATAAGTTVHLGARHAADGRVELYVCNPGPAIPAEVRSRLFEPFFTSKPRGTGLGLAIARKIARAHGGDVQLTCNEPGHVRFSLWLPLRGAEPPSGCEA